MPGDNLNIHEETARLYEKHQGKIVDMARELGIARTTMQSRVETARIKGYIEEIVRIEDDRDIRTVYLKPNYKIYQRHKPKGETLKVLAIGDCHDGLDIPDKTRFHAMGRYAANHSVDHIVQIGDFTSMDSMSSHEPNWTIKGQSKPSFKDEVASFSDALAAFDEGLGGYQTTKHVTLGNHEDRIARFVNNNPELAEFVYEKIYELLGDFGWSYSPFGEFYFIGDVGFTHVPLNQMGKPYGGAHSENAIARDSLHDIVYGHTHKRVAKTFPKIGHDLITVVNLGCALPEGHIEDYAKHSVTGWSYGVYDLTIRDGKIKEHSWIPMDTLLRDYT